MGFNPVFASSDPIENASRLPYGKNYLDLRNIIRTEPRDLNMERPIKVKSGTTYTLVMGIEFIGPDNYSQDEFPSFDLCNGSGCDTVDLDIDLTNERWYITFLTTDEVFKFEGVPVYGFRSYDLILYEGTYADFSGFERYMSYPKTIYEGVYLVNYDQPVLESVIKSSVRAVDNFDGSSVKPIKVSDNYSNRTDKIGSFLIEYEVRDVMDNTSVYKMHVKVVDVVAPTLTGRLSYEVEAKDVDLTIDDIINNMVATDNVDALTKSNIDVVSDMFTPNEDKVGEFPIVLSATDSSGNQSQKTVKVIIKDTVAPTIKGPDVLYTYLNDIPKTLEQIRSLYTSYDRFDGDITSGIVIDLNGYKGNMLVVYEIYIKSTDIAGNRTIRTVHLHILDDVAPVFTSLEPVITSEALALMTQAEIVAWFQGELLKKGYDAGHVKVLLNEYEHGKNLSKAYIYFEYEIDGQVHQTRAKVDIKKNTVNFNYIYIGGATILSLGGALFIKKKIR